MKVAPYYQRLLEQGLQAASSLEPITYVGMFDSGVDYLFNLAIPLFGAELPKDVRPIFLDLSGLTSKKEVEQELCFMISEELKTEVSGGYQALVSVLRSEAKKNKLVFGIYLGQDGGIDQSFFLFLNRLRNLLGWRFSYVIFTTVRVLSEAAPLPIFNKVFKRNLVPVQPLMADDARVVLQNYEERYAKTLSKEKQEHIITLAGGNPGLIKALYLQAMHSAGWSTVNFLDEQLYFRLQGIANDLSIKAQEVLLGKRSPTDSPMVTYFLTRYRYAGTIGKKLVPFTALVTEYLQKYQFQTPKVTREKKVTVDSMLLNFTKSQRNVLEYLTVHAGELVTKDALAQVLWGDSWADRYSDWAIDQLISTLREKMAATKYEGNIVTKKGEGIIFCNA